MCVINIVDKYNEIHINFKKLTKISYIDIWNYAKTPQRGVQEIEIYFDGYLLYKVNTFLVGLYSNGS